MSIFIDLFDGFWREPGLIFSTYFGQPVFNKTLGVSKGQGSDFEIKCNTILKIGIFMDDIAHFRLAEHDQLQQFIIIGLKILQSAEHIQHFLREILPLIHHKNQGLALINSNPKQGIFDNVAALLDRLACFVDAE